MELNRTIHVDFQVWQALTTRRATEATTENDVIRQLLELPPLPMPPGPLAVLASGDQVRHPTYGFGVVENRSGTEATVRFAGESRSRIFGIPEAEKAGMVKVPERDSPPPPPVRSGLREPSLQGKLKKLKVIFPDRVEIFRNQVVKTFVAALEKIGPERVSRLGISMGGGFLVETHPGKRPGHWKALAGGRYYVNTNSSTDIKREQLERIRDELRDRFRVETV